MLKTVYWIFALVSVGYTSGNFFTQVSNSNGIIVSLKNPKQVSALCQKYNFATVKKLSKNLYLVKIADTNQTKTILYKLNHDPRVQYAHPDRIQKIIPR